MKDSSNQEEHGSEKCIYLDYNGTTPIDSRVFEAMVPYFTQHFGNPSSSHAYGTAPKAAVSKARRSIISLLDSSDEAKEESCIIFTGCGSEADNMAIHLAIEANSSIKRKHIITSNVEHPAIDQCLKTLESKGEIDVTYVPVNQEGIVATDDFLNAIKDDTILVTLMTANNESGALQPVKEVADICRKKGILFHTDAAQAVGKVSISLDDIGIGNGVDMVTIVGHKIGAPKGVAALYVRPGCLSESGRSVPSHYGSCGLLLQGGGQEQGRRAGTENVPYIVAMGTAADMFMNSSESHGTQWKENAFHMEELRNRLLQNLIAQLGQDNVKANGPADPLKRLPNTLSVGIRNVQSGELLRRIQTKVACSAGSACHSSGGALSPVLIAMGVPLEFAKGTLRLSVGPLTTEEDVDKAGDVIVFEARRQLDC